MGDRPLPEHASLFHFTVATARGWEQDDVATLLRRVAEALDELGAVDVHDITFHVDWTDEGSWPSMTVYYELDTDTGETTGDADATDVHDAAAVREALDAEPDTRAAAADATAPVATATEARATPAARREGVIAWDANVFAVDRVGEPFVGRAHVRDANGGGEVATKPAGEALVDVAAAETDERDETDVDLNEPTEDVTVADRVPVTSSADDVLPVNTTAPSGPSVPPVNVFPLRMHSSLDKTALRRLKDLWRTTSRRRPD